MTSQQGTSKSATVYHFGVSERTGRLVRYVYRSANGFVSEFSEEPGFAVKPAPSQQLESEPESLDEMIGLASQIRAEQNQVRTTDSIQIGGELVLAALTVDGQLASRVVHRFPDFDVMWESMNQRLRDTP